MLFYRKEDWRTLAAENSTLVAFGANLPGRDGASPRQILERAMLRVTRIPGLRSPVRSRWFSTGPMPASDQPRYVNAVLRLEGGIEPASLLASLHRIEAEEFRARGERNAARTLDLDVIAMGRLVRDTADPILPHPRAHLRAFVLLPLRDVAPGWVHPRTGETIRALIAALEPQDIRPV